MNKTTVTAENLTDAAITAFRAELIADPVARTTDAPYVCLRALSPARGKLQKAARAKARATVAAAMATWIESGRDGTQAILATLESGRAAIIARAKGG